MACDADGRNDDHSNSSAIFVYHHATNQRNNYVREGIKRVEKIELCLSELLSCVYKETVVYESFQCLAQRNITLAVSKQYSHPNTTKIATTTTKQRILVFLQSNFQICLGLFWLAIERANEELTIVEFLQKKMQKSNNQSLSEHFNLFLSYLKIQFISMKILCLIIYQLTLMINLYQGNETRSKLKNLTTANKTHIASMHLRTSTQYTPSKLQSRESARALPQARSRSGHKYKKSLILQESTIQLNKKYSQGVNKNKQVGLSTDRFMRGNHTKRSVDFGMKRTNSELQEGRGSTYNNVVQIDVQDLKSMLQKMSSLRGQKQNLKKQLAFYQKQIVKKKIKNSVLKALAC